MAGTVGRQRASSRRGGSRPAGRARAERPLLELQRTAGNAAVAAFLTMARGGGVQRSADITVSRSARPTLRLGSRGPDVVALQESLLGRGLALGRADGHFGPRTKQAVEAFQQSQGLGTDGVVGPRTWAALGGTSAPAAPAASEAGGAGAPAAGGTAPAAEAEDCPTTVPPDRSGVSVTSVGGITVATSLAPSLQQLLAAAAADGVQLSGGGFRSYESQVRLRRAHCGSTCFDIYQKRSRECTPPTATPGRSQHEVGLAIDFRNTRTQSTANFQWLNRRAREFGLINLPSEPWHWSTTGR